MGASSGPRRSSGQEPDGTGDGADRLSDLPDDVLLLVLARLPCAAAAARTGVLSRRWRGLWARLRQIVLRDVPFPSIEAPSSPIRVPQRQRRSRGFPSPKKQRVDSAGVNSLLRAAARLEPESLEFRLPADLIGRSRLAVDLPRLDGATSIALDFASPFSLRVPAGAEFPALEALSLTYSVTDLDALLSCCPRLRTLRLCRALFPNHKCDVRVSSPSLQELVVCRELSLTQRVDIVAPALKQLTMSFSTMELISSSVLAPLVEKVSWHCYYLGPYVAFGLWGISKLRLQTADRQEQMSSLQSHAWADTSLFYADAGNFAQEIKKHMVAAFSVLELHLTAKGHAFGAFVFHLLGMDRIRTATRRLKVVLERSAMKGGCLPLCPCGFPNWKSQIICLAALEEVEFNGFEGKDHEFDLVKLIIGCAPMLKRMIVKLSQETSASNDGCAKIHNIFKACSSVECDVYDSSGEYMFGMHY
uniref:F-box domain-containing protein n=2 Tax=Triticum aestivum TaxID=4565 RepID=A0A3B6TXQ8_WHEAT